MFVLENFVASNYNLFIVEPFQALSMKQTINPMILVQDSSVIQIEPLLSDVVTDLIWNVILKGICGHT